MKEAGEGFVEIFHLKNGELRECYECYQKISYIFKKIIILSKIYIQMSDFYSILL